VRKQNILGKGTNMFTVEIRINGTQIGHIYGQNMSVEGVENCEYNYEYYETGTGNIVSGTVHHNLKDKIRILITKILDEVDKEMLS
jgi:hypothetical protein